MKFYGTENSLKTWRSIIQDRLSAHCCEVRQEQSSGRWYFTANLTAADRAFLQENCWYAVEDGQEFAWNERISYSDR